MKQRVQHPKGHERKDRGGYHWFFRDRHDELLLDGSIKTTRKFHTIGPSRGENAISHKDACIRRDEFFADHNAAATKLEAALAAREPEKAPDPGDIIFGKLAELWRKGYVDNPKVRLAKPTRDKQNDRLACHILPRWKDARLSDLDNSKAIIYRYGRQCRDQ